MSLIDGGHLWQWHQSQGFDRLGVRCHRPTEICAEAHGGLDKLPVGGRVCHTDLVTLNRDVPACP